MIFKQMSETSEEVLAHGWAEGWAAPEWIHTLGNTCPSPAEAMAALTMRSPGLSVSAWYQEGYEHVLCYARWRLLYAWASLFTLGLAPIPSGSDWLILDEIHQAALLKILRTHHVLGGKIYIHKNARQAINTYFHAFFGWNLLTRPQFSKAMLAARSSTKDLIIGHHASQAWMHSLASIVQFCPPFIHNSHVLNKQALTQNWTPASLAAAPSLFRCGCACEEKPMSPIVVPTPPPPEPEPQAPPSSPDPSQDLLRELTEEFLEHDLIPSTSIHSESTPLTWRQRFEEKYHQQGRPLFVALYDELYLLITAPHQQDQPPITLGWLQLAQLVESLMTFWQDQPVVDKDHLWSCTKTSLLQLYAPDLTPTWFKTAASAELLYILHLFFTLAF